MAPVVCCPVRGYPQGEIPGAGGSAGITPRLLKGLIACLLLMLSLAAFAAEGPSDQQRMSIIIDDVGNNWRLGVAAVELPGNVTISVLPGLAHSRSLAERAHDRGRQVMLHMPMANHSRFPLGPMGLEMSMSKDEWLATLREALTDVPHAQGVNNHMGSLLTEHPDAMALVMSELAERELFFVDSLTSPRSIAYDTAIAHGVPALKRQVFLDHEATDEFISAQFAHALSIMERYGQVVVIGHPYPETLDFLEWILPLLDEAGIELVTPDQLIADNGEPPPATLPTSQRSEESQLDAP